ncbi:uncharacterized protein FRV6_15749 [Fusarium oxysporum]|uniref:Uncharacterized protein n=1 Tax=Fusarium oxysporum TaxID=5507 RepID=A0A2H3U0U8_FUSOX|nr:uncharacterized protein FRV6_15749 [Fusarium oxysporum]
MSNKTSNETTMVAEKPPKAPEEKPSEKSVEADNMSVKATTGHGVKGHEKAAPEAKEVRYASYYGDGSGLPLRPGMGPPMTEEEFQESWKKSKARAERLWRMSDEEFYAQFPECNAVKDCYFTEEEAEGLLEGEDKDKPRYAHRYGDGSGLPLRPGMGPPRTEEEFEEEYKKIEAEEDKIFNMSEEEFNVEFPEYSKFTKDMPEYFCTEHEAWKIMEGYDEDEDRNHSDEKK